MFVKLMLMMFGLRGGGREEEGWEMGLLGYIEMSEELG